MDQDVHTYQAPGITVTFDDRRCIHARECVRGLPAVFDPDKRPWITPGNAPADELAAVIARCPTGALHFERVDGGPAEPVPADNSIAVAPDGPLYAHGDVDVVTPEGRELLRDTRVALCRCGASGNKPLCDNTHRAIGFEAAGTVPQRAPDAMEPDGGSTLTVTPTPDGPLQVRGEATLRGLTDGSSRRIHDVALCRCGRSGNKPFCDGTHAEIGFTTDTR